MSGALATETTNRDLADPAMFAKAKDGVHAATAFKAYAIKARNLELLYQAIEKQFHHETEAGMMLLSLGERRGGDQTHETSSLPRKPSNKELGISNNESSRWKRLAALPHDELDAHIAQAKERAAKAISRGCRNVNPEPKKRRAAAGAQQVAAVRKLFNEMGARAFYLALAEEQKDALSDEMNAEWEEREARKAQVNQLKEELRRSA